MCTENAITPKTNIYRYMSLVRFIQLLEEGFFISTANNFEDAYDAKIPHSALTEEAKLHKKNLNERINQIFSEATERSCVEGQRKSSINELIREAINSAIFRFQKECGKSTHSRLSEAKIMETVDCIVTEKGEQDKKLDELFMILDQESYDATLISCWNRSSEESYLMWKSYAETGVRIKTTIGKFKDHIEDYAKRCGKNLREITGEAFSNGEVYNHALQIIREGKVEYLPQEEFENRLAQNESDPERWLFRKLYAYREEQEYRFIFEGRDGNPGYTKKLRSRYAKGLVVRGIDTIPIIEEVLISPLIPPNSQKALIRFLEEKSPFLKGKVSSSKLPIRNN